VVAKLAGAVGSLIGAFAVDATFHGGCSSLRIWSTERGSIRTTSSGQLVSITLKTHKRLWGNGGNTCAFPGCDQRLFLPMEGEDDEVAVGKECHIVAQRDGGPRAPSGLSAEEVERFGHLIESRDGYANLILLCGIHHDVIDGDLAAYSVERLVAMKQAHERALDERRTPQLRHSEAIELRYAAIVDEWANRIHIDEWDGRMSGIVINGAAMEEVFDDLESLGDWLLRRVWPRTHLNLEDSLLNFRIIAQDLQAVVAHYETRRNGRILIDRAYKENLYDEETYQFLSVRSEYIRDLAADLTVELTRAVNLVADRVREHLWPNYRLEDGYATIGLGMGMDLTFRTLRPLYAVDSSSRPYGGLREFLDERAQRDYVIGEGRPPRGAGLPGAVWGDEDLDGD
jgi:hypothetical protein